MSFFTNGAAVGEVETLDQLMANTSIKESVYDDYLEGALAAVAESVDNDNRLMMAIGIQESAYFAETGKEFVYTEGVLSSVWNKVKEIVMKIWNKIKELFKRFVAMFDKFFASDKSFVKKYKKRILMANTTDLEYEGYKFENLNKDLPVPGDSSVTDIKIAGEITDAKGDISAKDTDEKRSDLIDDKLDQMRAVYCGKQNGKVSSSEFNTELKDYLYGDKETLSNINLTTQINYIENYADTKKKAEKVKKEVDSFFNKIIKKIEELSKEATNKITTDSPDKENDKNRTEVNVLGHAKRFFTQASQIAATATGVYLNALKDRNRQARAICVKAMTKGGSFKEESASFEYPAYGSNFLEQVKFI